MLTDKDSLRVIFTREPDGLHWLAYSPEYDLYGDGPTMQEALTCLQQALSIQAEITKEFKSPDNLLRNGRRLSDEQLDRLVELVRKS